MQGASSESFLLLLTPVQLYEDDVDVENQVTEDIHIPVSYLSMMATLKDLYNDNMEMNITDSIEEMEVVQWPHPKLTAPHTKRLVEYIGYYMEHSDEVKDTNLNQFDINFFKGLEMSVLLELLEVADFIDCEKLLDCGTLYVAQVIKGKTPEELRQIFGVENDFTPEQEDQIRKEHEWCDEKK